MTGVGVGFVRQLRQKYGALPIVLLSGDSGGVKIALEEAKIPNFGIEVLNTSANAKQLQP